MLPVIGVFLCVAFGLYICCFIVGLVVQFIASFVIPVVTLFGLVIGFGTMLGRMLTSVVSFIIKFFMAVTIFCNCVLPLIFRGWRNLYHALPDVMNNIEWHIENLRNVFEDAIDQHGEWLLYLWGIILVPLYYISSQIRNVARNENNMHRNNGENMAEFDNLNNENADGAQQYGDYHDDGIRNRQMPQPPPQPPRQRLYPDLPDINYNEFDRREANNNNNNVGNGFLNNNNMNVNRMNDSDERLCVICFNHERKVAVFPCGHTWLCEQCTRELMRRNNLCPFCQGRILEYRTVYL